MTAQVYLARIRSMPCVLCMHLGLGATPSEAHHVFDTAARSDWLTVPLCAEHHRGGSGFHGMGQRAFERAYKITEAGLLAMTIERMNAWNGTGFCGA